MATAFEPTSPVCPMCGGPLATTDLQCPQCGEPVQSPKLSPVPPLPDMSHDFRPAEDRDYVLCGLIGLVAVGLTLPPNVFLLNAMSNFFDPVAIMMVGGWTSWIWGLPVLVVATRWRAAVLAGVTDQSHLYRAFWRSQALTVGIPFALFLLLLAVCAVSM